MRITTNLWRNTVSNIVWILYLADVCNSVNVVSNLCAIISAFLLVVIAFIYLCNEYDFYEDTKKHIKRLLKALVVIFGISMPLVLFVPAKSVILAWAGVEATQIVVEKTSNSPVVEKALKLIEKQLDEALNSNTKAEEKK